MHAAIPTSRQPTRATLVGLTHEQVRQQFIYYPETGAIWRIARADGRKVTPFRCDKARSCTYSDIRLALYRWVSIRKHYKPAHRVAWFWVTGSLPGGIDHKDRDGQNNKWDNLRVADQSENLANSRLRNNNTSGQRGVSWNTEKQKWVAVICFKKIRYHIGYYRNKESAIADYKKAQHSIHGVFANVS